MPIFDNSGVVTDPNVSLNKPTTTSTPTSGQNVNITVPTGSGLVEAKSSNTLLYLIGAVAAYYFLFKKKK
jgi:hypothetical protein